eukprot:4521038-Pyramimonas_sp.AAC.1
MRLPRRPQARSAYQRGPQDSPRGLQGALFESPRRPEPSLCVFLRCLKDFEVLECLALRPRFSGVEGHAQLSSLPWASGNSSGVEL